VSMEGVRRGARKRRETRESNLWLKWLESRTRDRAARNLAKWPEKEDYSLG